jgi:alkanesulfonate monooxygenase SsuD/methylene tetrahydromethanopterin reductase-like flavin-dependent oxidoreductase (luciferase family)
LAPRRPCHSYRGTHLTLEDARVFDLPDTPPRIAVAIGGPVAAQVAVGLGDAIFATEPEAELVEAYRKAGGDGPRYGEVPLAWAPDEATAVESAHRLIRFGPTGWKVMSELPNPSTSRPRPRSSPPTTSARRPPAGAL